MNGSFTGRGFWTAVLTSVSLLLALATTSSATSSLERTGGWPYAGAYALAVDTDRDLLYLGSGGVVLVLDVSNPAVPQLVFDGFHRKRCQE